MKNAEEIAQKVQTTLRENDLLQANALLFDLTVRQVDGSPSLQEVGSVLPTLQARYANSQKSGKKIYGLDQLIASLSKMDPSSKVLVYGFISDYSAGNFYFSSSFGECIGAAVVAL